MRSDAGADQYRIISSDTSYNLALCTGNAPRLLIAGNSAATSIGGSNVFNAMLTVQGDISGQLFTLKATENTSRMMISDRISQVKKSKKNTVLLRFPSPSNTPNDQEVTEYMATIT